MTYKEAASRIRKHNEIHSRKERNAVFITEALNLAVEVLEKLENAKNFKCSSCRFSDKKGCVGDTIYCWKHGAFFLENDFCNYAELQKSAQNTDELI